MSETTRKPLQEHTNPSASAEAESHGIKKPKTALPPKILTFKLSHSPVKVQVLSTQTVFDLVDIICQETTVGMDEGVYDHMWDLVVPMRGMYNSSDAYVDSMSDWASKSSFKASQTKLSDLQLSLDSTMTLDYDYGTTSHYTIQLVEETPYDETGTFPRRKPIEAPSGMVEFNTDQANLNTMFPTFNKWISEAEQIGLNFFQPGRKHNYGLQERGNDGVRHMIFLPAKPGNDLADYLHCFDYASQFEYSKDEKWGTPNYDWYSMVVFPLDGTIKSYVKYASNQEAGFCEAKVAPDSSDLPSLNKIFPKVAALAGYKLDFTVMKGWFTYKDKTLRICSGGSTVVKSNCPKFTAFVGLDQHEPDPASSVVIAEVQVEIKSLHHLFCVVEGLLMSI